MPFTQINKVQLYFEEHGSGEPLLLIHGLGTGSADWTQQLDALAAHYRVIVPCLRGFGKSERHHGEYTIALFAADMIALLDYLQIETAHFCGLSMGGAVAFQAAVNYPDRLRSLIVINSQPSFELNTLRKKLMFFGRSWMARYLGLSVVSAVLLRQNFPGSRHRALRRERRGLYENDPDIYLAAMEALENWTVVPELSAITVPLLVIASEHDYSSPGEKAQLVATVADKRLVTIAGARHAVHIERPEEVNHAILEFLAGLAQRR